MSTIVGRTEELDALFAFVEDAKAGPAALVLEGDPGIGKSTLLEAAVEHGREQGIRVLLARPTEPERGLGHVALGDLLDGTLDDVLPVLPPPRRHALEVMLLLAEPDDDAVDPRAVALATRSALEALAERTPLLVAIDDVQWLDPSSERALAFALRRLDGECPLRLLLARRSRTAVGARACAGPEHFLRLAVAPLEHRRAPPVPPCPARPSLRAPDAAAHPRAVGRESVLRPRAGPRRRPRRRPDAAAARSRDAGGARPTATRGTTRVDPRRARAPLGVGLGVAGICSSAPRSGRPRSSRRLPPRCSSATTASSDSPIRCWPPSSTAAWATSGSPFTRGSRRSWTSRSSGRATSRSRGRPRTRALRVRSTRQCRWRPGAARPPSRRSSPSTRSG